MSRHAPYPNLLRSVPLLFGSITLCMTFFVTTLVLMAAPASATFDDLPDSKKQTTIVVTGPGSVVTLSEIRSAIAATSTTYLVDKGSGIWQLNVNLVIGAGVTLDLSPATGVTELRLRSGNNGVVTLQERIAASNSPDTPEAIAAIQYSTFVYLKTESGTLQIDGVKLYSWDEATNQVDQDETNGRAYLLARDAATMTIRNADIGYLGSKDGESYGLSWRDSGEQNGEFLTRVTGELINSKIHHNYYGVYTYQARDMTFRGNEFYENIRYGFDPHDYSHHVIVENNVAHHNGAHGFIISRGCNNFVFRNNVAYSNMDPGSNLAHGFMLDPGGATIDKPQVSSSNNLLENNEAYDNEGYGIRILGSSDNILRQNNFHHNEMGISIDANSNNNHVENNRIEANRRYGFYIRDNQANTIVANQINHNGGDGLNLSSGAKQTQILRNTISNNGGFGIVVSGSSTTGTIWSQNSISGNQSGGIDDRVRKLGPPQLTSVVGNRVEGRAKAGATVELFAGDDAGAQGARYLGATTADSGGAFAYVSGGSWGGPYLTAIALDGVNASSFSNALAAGEIILNTPTPSVMPLPSVTPTTTVATITPIPTGTATSLPPTTTTPTETPATPLPTATPTVFMTVTTTPVQMATATATTAPRSTPTTTITPEATPGGTGSTQQIYLPLIWAQ